MNGTPRQILVGFAALLLALLAGMTLPAFGLTLEGQRVRVDVDEAHCRWSARLKDSPLSLKNVYFLPEDNPAGWTVKAAYNENDNSPLGRFETVTLHGTKPGELDFDYQISANKVTGDIIVSLGRANNTGKTVEIGDMDYMVAPNARLGGTSDQWMTFGTRSSYKDYYRLTSVNDIKTDLMYETEQLARNRRTGAVILMGHLTVWKGHSRFSFAKGDSAESMKMRAYCNYKVTMPTGRSFAGEKLLVSMGENGQQVLEHLGDLIAAANDVRLKERCPINPDDRGLIAGTHGRFMNWMSGSKRGDPDKFFERHGLGKFYYADKNPESGAQTSWAHYYSGGGGIYFKGTKYPDSCYLPVLITWPFGNPCENNGGRVIDFSNPLAVQCERARVFKTLAGEPDKVHWAHLDYSELWDKWPGQHDPFMSAAETWRAGAMPWREIKKVCPRERNRACMAKVDFSYGLIDIARTSDDADYNYGAFLNQAIIGTAMRYFYNGRVYWNDCDNFHIYRYQNGEFSYGEGKVAANYRAFAGSTTLPSEKFDVDYPPERLELLKRISPVTMDVSYPVDLFERIPASTWNMPIRRPFGQWNVVAVFNYGSRNEKSNAAQAGLLTITMDAAKDLRLDSEKEYVVYEFWSKKLVGTFKGSFTSAPIKSKDCHIYSIMEKLDRPLLVSTSRHIRQMAFDIKKLAWSGDTKSLSGLSRAVSGDPYQLRIYVPAGFSLERVNLSGGLKAVTNTDGQLLTVDFTTSDDSDVTWSVFFKESNAVSATGAAPPETSGGWKKFEGNPVMGGKYGTCFDVSVLREGGKYRMWLSWRPKGSVALIESKDGIHWSEPPQVVLGPRKETGWEDDVNRPCVLKKGDAYHMWYTGQAKPGARDGHSWIGYATSPDGVTWKRASDKPVLSFDQPWEKNIAVMSPSVIWDERAMLFRMWYSGGEQNEPNAIGYATSPDGLTWKKYVGNPVFGPEPKNPWEKHKVAGVQVERRGGWYVMFYIGYQEEPNARICLARSKDGITNWQRHPANPIIVPGKNQWDHNACYKPYAIFDGKKWLLWYNGRHSSLEQIGVVIHEGEDLGFDQ